MYIFSKIKLYHFVEEKEETTSSSGSSKQMNVWCGHVIPSSYEFFVCITWNPFNYIN